MVCAAFSLADALALRSLEIPAATAHGLLSLGPEQMPELTRCFEVDRARLAPELEDDEDANPQDEPKIRIVDHVPSDEVPFGKIVFDTSSAPDKSPGGESPESDPAEDGAEEAGLFCLEQRFRLTFAPWSPLRPGDAPPEAYQHAVADWLRLKQCLGVRLYSIKTWLPTPQEIEAVELCLARKAAEWLTDVVQGSLGQSRRPIGEDRALAPQEPQNCIDALALWRQRRGCKHSVLDGGPDLQKKARRDLKRLLDRDLIDPLLKQAAATEDPLQRNLIFAHAQLSRVFHLQAAVVSEKAAGGSAAPLNYRDDLQPLLATADRLLKLGQAIAQGRDEPASKVIAAELIPNATAGLPASTPPRRN